LRGALWLSHNDFNFPLLGSVVNSWRGFFPTWRCSKLSAALVTQQRGLD
jgi:hypothetical protein